MAEGKMGLTSRLICECVRDNPDMTMLELATKMGANLETIKKLVRTLVERRYLKRGRRTAVGYRMKATGKPFPSSESYTQHPDWLRQVQAAQERVAMIDVVMPAMHAMIQVGRETA